MATDRIRVSTELSSENYQNLQEYIAQEELSEAMAINAIVGSYFAGKSEDELIVRMARIEQELSELKRHLLAIRFR